jgi:energy-coupling factor transporter ATP-binding protein EcfA2
MSVRSDVFLRPEAGPIPFDSLPSRLQRALEKIVDSLRAAADAAKAHRATSKDRGIDLNRASRLFFVSGEPGSGKSTLYLTLRAILSSEEGLEKYGGNLRKERGKKTI